MQKDMLVSRDGLGASRVPQRASSGARMFVNACDTQRCISLSLGHASKLRQRSNARTSSKLRHPTRTTVRIPDHDLQASLGANPICCERPVLGGRGLLARSSGDRALARAPLLASQAFVPSRALSWHAGARLSSSSKQLANGTVSGGARDTHMTARSALPFRFFFLLLHRSH